jgi:hypothetical protein
VSGKRKGRSDGANHAKEARFERMRKPPFFGGTAASGAVTRNGVVAWFALAAAFSLFLLYKFRIPDSASNYANFLRITQTISGVL